MLSPDSPFRIKGHIKELVGIKFPRSGGSNDDLVFLASSACFNAADP